MRRPNILILYTDQQRSDALGANGNRDIRTPNLDRLARLGVNYTRFHVQNPVCMPSRYSFLSSRYCSSLGVFHNGVPVPEDARCLPGLLAPYGYRRANIGKLHFLPHANRDHREPHPAYGFDHLEISDEPGCYEDAYRAWVRHRDPSRLDRISVGLPPAAERWESIVRRGDRVQHPEERFPKRAIPFEGGADFTHTAFVADQTLEYLRQRGRDGSPFLCIAGFYSPHSPWVMPQEFLDLYTPQNLTLPRLPSGTPATPGEGAFSEEEVRSAVHGYYAMVSEVDHHVGRILRGLEEAGLAEDTIIVFTSDHGEFLGEFHRYGKGYPAPDCISRTPLIVYDPRGATEAGYACPHLTEAVDVVPTLLTLAGIPVPRDLQGQMLPLQSGDAPARKSALTEMEGSRSLRTDRHRYIVHRDGRECLYEPEGPGGEYADLAREEAAAPILHEMRLEMIRRVLDMERHRPRTVEY